MARAARGYLRTRSSRSATSLTRSLSSFTLSCTEARTSSTASLSRSVSLPRGSSIARPVDMASSMRLSAPQAREDTEEHAEPGRHEERTCRLLPRVRHDVVLHPVEAVVSELDHAALGD